jgi:hypothetical protein
MIVVYFNVFILIGLKKGFCFWKIYKQDNPLQLFPSNDFQKFRNQ